MKMNSQVFIMKHNQFTADHKLQEMSSLLYFCTPANSC